MDESVVVGMHVMKEPRTDKDAPVSFLERQLVYGVKIFGQLVQDTLVINVQICWNPLESLPIVPRAG